MVLENWKDCYAKWENQVLCIGNSRIERRFYLRGDKLITLSVLNKKTGYCWENGAGVQTIEQENLNMECNTGTDNNGGLSAEYYYTELICRYGEKYTVIYRLDIYPELPFVRLSQKVKGIRGESVQNTDADYNGAETKYAAYNALLNLNTVGDICDIIPLPNAHLKSECIALFDKTDGYDTLVKSEKQQVYAREQYHGIGNIIVFTDYESGDSMIVCKNAPTHTSSIGYTGEDMYIAYGYLQVMGTGYDGTIAEDEYTELYGTTLGVGEENIEELYQAYERASKLGNGHSNTYIMSNTWGDRHQDRAVCHDFIIKEIDRAYEMGVDIVQIDDGWQKGITVNSGLGDNGIWSGYYDTDPTFWEVNSAKFPQGLEPVAKYAAERGIKLGLWFGPDSSNNFKNWEKDVQTLLGLHRKYGICYFKLDGVTFDTKLGEMNFIRFMDTLCRESGYKISYNLDVTAQNRVGYIMGTEFGTLFVENRYTDWVNYYPHNTLKNLWSLTRFFPPRKFQFELLNNKRNRELYGNDSMAPAMYEMDYEFAATMMSNPLVWMEMSELDQADVKVLSKITNVYRQHRANLWNASIRPIGDEPDGRSFTGFEAICENGERYLLLFRENTDNTAYSFKLSDTVDVEKLELLYASEASENGMSAYPDGLTWECSQPRSFAFYKIAD